MTREEQISESDGGHQCSPTLQCGVEDPAPQEVWLGMSGFILDLKRFRSIPEKVEASL